MSEASKHLDFLNETYFPLHKKYEEYFWLSYMGDHSVNEEKDKALFKRDEFRSNEEYLEKTKTLIKKASKTEKDRLMHWLDFFNRFQTPNEARSIKEKIDKLESKIEKIRSTRKEGYIDPMTKKFMEASENKMSTMIRTNPDEAIRKACFEAREKLAEELVDKYVELVKSRNEYARTLGYKDFYDYKIQIEEGMTKKELFSIFDSIYSKTKYSFKDIRKLEKTIPNLRKPWNFGYMMTGDFAKEEDNYFQFDDALIRWGRSFSALGIDFRKSKLQLDLLDRKGKFNNGFCHWPEVVRYERGKRIPGTSNFTCNVIFGQIGSGFVGFETLFHEGGHSAHLMNSDQKDICINHEYPPASTAWDETQSMFLDTMFSGIDWKMRYAKDKDGNSYPFELFERKVRKLSVLYPMDLYGIMFVMNFEKNIYESKDINKDLVIKIAKKNFKKFFDRDVDSIYSLNIPHIYSWGSACSYHGYGLATLALDQWREYFYKKYGYIVDNKNVGKEMTKVWKLAASKSFPELVKIATGKRLSPDAHIRSITLSAEETIRKAKQRILKLEKVKPYNKRVNLNADIKMVHGKEKIANNKKSFEDMAQNYKKWLHSTLKN